MIRLSLPRRASGVFVALALLVPIGNADAAPRRRVSGWLTYWNTAENLRHITANADLYRAISPFWYRADGTTSIYAHPGAGSRAVMDAARSKALPVVPTITETMGPAAMAAILSSPTKRAAHENAIVSLVMRHGYHGIDVDYEQFLVTRDQTIAQRNKDGFSAFTIDLCGKLRDRGKRCVITVNARTDDAMQANYRPSHSVGVFDYAVITKHATTMRIMTYGQHYPTGKPGPVAGYPWVDAVAKYTASKAGQYRYKVEIGVAQVAYNWGKPGVRAVTYTYEQAMAKKRAVGARDRWSDTERSPWFAYRDGQGVAHYVWYDDARSGASRARLADRYGFAGIALWYPGIEDPNLWPALRQLANS